ncbi:MAG: hypothetical protein JO179_10250 [Solirubrobacterales bacterium]|nr:hypothetical protein [Solirubrobacterales bacterium]
MRRLAVIVAAGVVVLLLILTQLLLPRIAAQRLRDRLSRSGDVLHVEVHAFPAIELLWHHADRVVIRLAEYRAPAGDLGSQLAQAGDVGTLDAQAARVDSGLLTLHDARLRKRGDELTGTATVNTQELRAAVPFLDDLRPVASADGQLTLRGTASLFGITGSVDATVATDAGRLIVRPNVPLGALATVTLFDSPHVEIQSVSARPGASGFSVSAAGRLR